LFGTTSELTNGNRIGKKRKDFVTLLDMAAEAVTEAALARKHRIAMRNRNRTVSKTPSDEENVNNDDEIRSNKRPRVALEAEPVVVSSSPVVSESQTMATTTATATTSKSTPTDILASMRKKKPHITGIKKQSRYDPGVAMTKEELKAWRKEARRVRNRESAAESRKKNRDSIDVLEVRVKEVQSKYDTAIQYILALEEQLRRSGSSSSSSFYPSDVLREDLEEARKSSPQDKESTRQMVSPPQSPTPTALPQEEGIQVQGQRSWPVQVPNDHDKTTPCHPFSRHYSNFPSTLDSQKHIIDNTIIRPIACV